MKNKYKQTRHSRRETLLSHISIAVLSVAAALTVVELDHVRPKVLQPQGASSGFVHALEGGSRSGDHHEPMRKDKEEIRHMTHSYGVMMRSQPTAGTA